MPAPRALLAAALAAGAAAIAAAPAQAEPLIGLTHTNGVFHFDSASPGTANPAGALDLTSDLNPGDTLIAIDRDPNDGQLYGLGSQSRMYAINENTGTATQVGPQFSTLLTSTQAGLDFDPESGLARIVTDSDQNLVWSPGSGQVSAQTALAFPGGSPDPSVRGLAYTNNVPGGQDPTAFGYNYLTDQLVRLGSPGGTPDSAATGKLTVVGPSGLTANNNVTGLDEGPTGTMFALLRNNVPNTATRLWTVDKPSGTHTAPAVIGTGADVVRDIATEAVSNNFEFSAASYDVSESEPTVTLTVTRDQSLGTGRVTFTSADASAATGRDYTGSASILFFAAGETSKTFELRIRADLVDEDVETFTVALSDPNGGHAAVTAPSTAVVQIQDDDTGPPPSTRVTALTTTNELVTFDSAATGDVSAPLAITGLSAGEELQAIDRRPSTGQLYAMSDESRLYTVDEATGAATLVGGGQFSPALTGSAWGFDFDPVADRIRVTGYTSAQNLQINPNDATAAEDTALTYPDGPHAGQAARVAALGYTDNVPGATATTLFGYDYQQDELARIGSPNGDPSPASSGLAATIGKSGIQTSPAQNVGLDIAPDGRAWALLRDASQTRLNVVDLTTGRVALVGDIGTGANVYRDIALPGVTNVAQLGATGFGGTEASGVATVTVTRNQSLGAASVDFATADGTATGGADYTATSGRLTFAPGETSKDVGVPVANDTRQEAAETFTLSISNPVGGAASLGIPATATVTIGDDDDNTKPRVTTCHRSRQKVRRQKAVRVCVRSNESGRAVVTGRLSIAGVRKRYTLKRATRAVVRNRRRTLKLKPPRAALAKLRGGRGRGTAVVTIRVRDAAGNTGRLKRRIRAVR
jgi:hypothetical protein